MLCLFQIQGMTLLFFSKLLLIHINYSLFSQPAARAESLFFDNVPVDKIGIKNERRTNMEYLGGDMVEAGNEFGAGTPYGAALIRVGQTQLK